MLDVQNVLLIENLITNTVIILKYFYLNEVIIQCHCHHVYNVHIVIIHILYSRK